MKFNDQQMIRMGQLLNAVGIVLILLPFGNALLPVGLVVAGLGCAPIYPCIIHSTPAHFGADRSQAIIGVQMACAYVGVVVIRQVAEPRIVGRQLGLYPLLTMMAMYAGYRLIGFLGLLLGPVLLQVMKAMLEADAAVQAVIPSEHR